MIRYWFYNIKKKKKKKKVSMPKRQSTDVETGGRNLKNRRGPYVARKSQFRLTVGSVTLNFASHAFVH